MLRDRYLKEFIVRLAFGRGKMAFISGPRQVGKTFLAKALLDERGGAGKYCNWDSRDFKRAWARSPGAVLRELNSSPTPMIVLDEIHKQRGWRTDLKGIFDTADFKVDFLVTGSAKFATFRRGGDSLLGRYLSFRLHPLSVRELVHSLPPPSPDAFLESLDGEESAEVREQAAVVVTKLLEFGGFPEPYFSNDRAFVNVWRNTRLEALVREDIRDLSRLLELGQVQLLASLLPERVGSALSRAALREDLQVAHTTVTRWLAYLSAVYYFFEIRPYARSIKRTLKREGKIYVWDYGEVEADGARFENLIASHLLKACDFWTDAGMGKFALHYLRDKSGHEIDFLITRDNKPWLPIEVKLTNAELAPGFAVFLPQVKTKRALQIVRHSGISRRQRVGETLVQIVSCDRILHKLA